MKRRVMNTAALPGPGSVCVRLANSGSPGSVCVRLANSGSPGSVCEKLANSGSPGSVCEKLANSGSPGSVCEKLATCNSGSPGSVCVRLANSGSPGSVCEKLATCNSGSPGSVCEKLATCNSGSPGSVCVRLANSGSPGSVCVRLANSGSPGSVCEKLATCNSGSPGSVCVRLANSGSPGSVCVRLANSGSPGSVCVRLANSGSPGSVCVRLANSGGPGSVCVRLANSGGPGSVCERLPAPLRTQLAQVTSAWVEDVSARGPVGCGHRQRTRPAPDLVSRRCYGGPVSNLAATADAPLPPHALPIIGERCSVSSSSPEREPGAGRKSRKQRLLGYFKKKAKPRWPFLAEKTSQKSQGTSTKLKRDPRLTCSQPDIAHQGYDSPLRRPSLAPAAANGRVRGPTRPDSGQNGQDCAYAEVLPKEDATTSREQQDGATGYSPSHEGSTSGYNHRQQHTAPGLLLQSTGLPSSTVGSRTVNQRTHMEALLALGFLREAAWYPGYAVPETGRLRLKVALLSLSN
ncbi:hypothetical protein Bbelb_357940 [Branchiostoma belcheri]|nr:hypothetical protein Bbelb_357940 [Branchiostoma belcheri]